MGKKEATKVLTLKKQMNFLLSTGYSFNFIARTNSVVIIHLLKEMIG